MTSPHSYALQSQIPAAPRLEQPTALPETFSFSQSSLQAFDDCARRFWLAYVQQLPWPAVEAAPVQDHERLMRLGAHFHKLVERAEIGMPMFRAVADLEDPLAGWFSAYEQHRPAGLPSEFIEVEHVLSIPFGEDEGGEQGSGGAGEQVARYRLAAKYDLIAAERDGRVAIVRLEDDPPPHRSQHAQPPLADHRLPVCFGRGKRDLALGSGAAGAG